MTIQLYLQDTYLFECEGRIIKLGEDEKGNFIIVDQTIFYPQGGGQPSDQGIIKNNDFELNVTLVRQIENEIRHYVTLSQNKIPIDSTVNCFIDIERRLLNGRYHTAAHLLGNIIELMYPNIKAAKGHSFPKEAYVEFSKINLDALGDAAIDAVKIQKLVNEAIARNDKTNTFEIDSISFQKEFYKLPYSISENKKFRAVQIGEMLPVPCGGTHLSSIGEIGNVSIGKIKVKNDTIRISYELIT